MDCTSKCRLARHADVLLSAVTREDLQDIESFVKYYCGNGTQARDSFGRNALHLAASCGRKDVLKWFLDEGFLEVNENDWESGWTPLHRACYYGHFSCALLLLQYGANIDEKDFEGLSPIELLKLDSQWVSITEPQGTNVMDCTYRFDVYSWGRNTNFTLAHGDDNERIMPEIVDCFARMPHSIREVVICKFHTVFLADNGSVWTCGHGLGGRLGHGHEKTILIPKKIEGLDSQVCTGIAAGQDHTVVLCENGNVFTFGLNKYHQLGHHPPAAQFLIPKQILKKSLKGKKFIGIAAGKFHTLMYTENEVFSWGLNAGQLGYIKGDRTQVLPRQISGLHLKDTSILSVTCCDVATVCLTNNGDVYLIYQYTQRKIVSKLPNITQLVVTGGRFEDSLLKQLKDEKFGPLTIYGLYGDGCVFQWRESDKCLRDCRWTIQKPLSVRHIACGKSLLIVTAHGEVYTEDGTNASTKKPTKISVKNQNVVKTNNALKEDEILEVPLIRVRHIHRAVKIISDKYSQNFVVLQADPALECSIIPQISSPEINNHLRRLFEEVTETYDMEIKVKDKSLYAHQVILAQGSEKLRTLINDAKQESCNAIEFPQTPIIYLDEEDLEITKEIIEFLYTGSCDLLRGLEEEYSVSKSLNDRELTEDEILNELALSLQDVDFDLLDLPFHSVVSESQHFKREKKSMQPSQQNGKFSEYKEDFERRRKEQNSVELLAKRKELLRVAKKYRISELVSRFHDSSDNVGVRPKSFHRIKLSEYSDVVIEADDGVEFFCHKSILAARLEYFSTMLTAGWRESSDDFVRLEMPISSRVLKVIIEFLYTDDALAVKESKDLEFLGKVLAVADQLWIIRLREMCEATLASLISLKNGAEMLEFSCLYNAEKLKSACLEFLCLNISSLFEARSLETLSDEVLEKVSKVYREMIPRMSWRVITPNDIHLSVPFPQPESPSKRKSSRSQRRSRTSESDVIEERATAMQRNGTEANELAVEKVEMDEKLPETEQTNDGKHDIVVTSRRMPKNSNSSEESLENDVKKGESITKTNTCKWYQKHPKDCSIFVTPLKKELKESEALPFPVCGGKNGDPEEKVPWGSPSPQSSNLRAIMEQELSEKKAILSKPRKEGKSPVSGGKYRMSQKERKKMRRSAEEPETFLNPSYSSEPEQNGHDIETSPVLVNPWNNISPVSRPAVSFRQLLEEEEGLGSNMSNGKQKFTAVKQTVSNSSVAQNKYRTTSVWQNKNIASSPPGNSCMKFDKIQELQEQETANRERDMKKPLSLIQIEDKAIEQLLEHYGGRYNPCEYIVVERETQASGSPDWVK